MDNLIPPVDAGSVSASQADPSSSNTNSGTLTSDVSIFEKSLVEVEQSALIESSGDVARGLLEPLGDINTRASDLAEYAQNAIESGDELSPSEIVALTVKSQEFMFHSQLTANVANRTADGIQQLFRQQG